MSSRIVFLMKISRKFKESVCQNWFIGKNARKRANSA